MLSETVGGFLCSMVREGPGAREALRREHLT